MKYTPMSKKCSLVFFLDTIYEINECGADDFHRGFQ